MGNEKYTITIDGKIICENETKKGVVQKVTSYIFAENSFEYSSKKVFFDYYKDTMRAIISDGEYIKEMEIIQSKPKNEQKIKHFPEVFCFGGNEWHFSCDKWPGQGKSLNPNHEKFKPFVQKVKEIFPCIEITSEPIESKDSPTSTIPSYRIPVSEKTESNEGKGARNAKFLAEIAKTWIDGNLCFCTDDVVMKDDVVNILTGLFSGMKNIFTERYQKMCDNWWKNWLKKPEIWTQNGMTVCEKEKKKKFFKDALLPVSLEYCQDDWCSEILKNYYNIGHDMPTWLYYKSNADGNDFPVEGRPRPRVMLISQDPLRSDHGEDKRLFLSTPWAFHSWNYIHNQNRFSLMKTLKIVHSYLNRGAIVYLTDYNKIFCRNKNGKAVKLNFPALMEKCLEQEIEKFKPNIIITIGGNAAKALTGAGLNQHYSEGKIPNKSSCFEQLENVGFHGDVYTKIHPSHSNGNNKKGIPSYVTDYWLREGSDRLGSGAYITEDILNKTPGQK